MFKPALWSSLIVGGVQYTVALGDGFQANSTLSDGHHIVQSNTGEFTSTSVVVVGVEVDSVKVAVVVPVVVPAVVVGVVLDSVKVAVVVPDVEGSVVVGVVVDSVNVAVVVTAVDVAVQDVLVSDVVLDVTVVVDSVFVVFDMDVLVSEVVVDDNVVVVIEIVVEDTVVLVADVVVIVVDVEDVVGQLPSPGTQSDGPKQAFPFLFCGTITS